MNNNNERKTMIIRLIAAIVLCVLLGSIGALVTETGPGSWYQSLEKPFFSPPNWLFAPMWTSLFILMGISLFLVWNTGLQHRDVQIAIGVFGIQFFFNLIWSFLFFGLQSPILGLLDIVLLWFMIIGTIIVFYPVKKKAAYLLVPYLIWVSCATILNYSIYILNP